MKTGDAGIADDLTEVKWDASRAFASIPKTLSKYFWTLFWTRLVHIHTQELVYVFQFVTTLHRIHAHNQLTLHTNSIPWVSIWIKKKQYAMNEIALGQSVTMAVWWQCTYISDWTSRFISNSLALIASKLEVVRSILNERVKLEKKISWGWN